MWGVHKACLKADDPDASLLVAHDCVYKEMSCSPRLVIPNKERIPQNTPKKAPIGKRLLIQGGEVNPLLL